MSTKVNYIFVPLTIGRDTAVIKLTRGCHALIDTEDWPRVFFIGKWHAHKVQHGSDFYARRDIGPNAIFLHNFVMQVDDCRKVDHSDRNKLNNRKGNLRIASLAMNMVNRIRRNKYGFRGIHKQTNGRFQALLKGRGLGTFITAEEAARAFDEAAKKEYGEFAILNFPEATTSAA